MSKIGVAGNLVAATAPLGYGHLQLVYSNGNTIEEIEVQSNWNVEDFPFLGPLGRWIFDGPQVHATNTPFYKSAFHYRVHYFDLNDGRKAEDIWSVLKEIHSQYTSKNPYIDYDRLKNSNSYATTLFNAVDIDIGQNLVVTTPLTVESFPGIITDVLRNTGASDTTDVISLLVFGTKGIDFINGGIKNDVFYGDAGDDQLRGHRGDDTFHPGSGNDTIDGGFFGQVSRQNDGLDTVDYSLADGEDAAPNLTPIQIILGEGEDSSNGTITIKDGPVFTDLLTSIEKIIGTDHDDTVILKGFIKEQLENLLFIDGGNNKKLVDKVSFGDLIDAKGFGSLDDLEFDLTNPNSQLVKKKVEISFSASKTSKQSGPAARTTS